MSGRKKLSDADRERIRRLHKDGLSYSAIAAQYDVDYRTISRTCNPEKYAEELKRNKEYSKKSKRKILDTRKANQRRYYLLLTRATDGDVINFLDGQGNINQYLKSLILKDMRETKQQSEQN